MRMRLLKTIRHWGCYYIGALAPLSFNLSGLIAGTILATSVDLLMIQSWGLLLFPSILSVRGAIGGLFSGRISTSLHIGTIRPSMRHNTKQLHLLYVAVATLSMISGIFLWIFACIFGTITLGLTLVDYYQMFLIVMTTLGISLVIISPVTAFVSIEAMKRGADPDVVTYPIISTVADILVTIIYVFVVTLTSKPWSQPVFITVTVIFLLFTSIASWMSRRESEMRKTIRETIFVLPLIAVFVNISGSTLDSISRIISTEPVIYIIYPAIIDTVGDVGSIVGSTATTKLNLGSIRSSLWIFVDQSKYIAGAWTASLTLFITYILIGSVGVGLSTSSIMIPILILRIVITNIIAVGLVTIISLSLALGTHRQGWDPDNFVIPVESTLADAITSIALLTAIILV